MLPAEEVESSASPAPAPGEDAGPRAGAPEVGHVAVMITCLYPHLHLGPLQESSARLDTAGLE